MLFLDIKFELNIQKQRFYFQINISEGDQRIALQMYQSGAASAISKLGENKEAVTTPAAYTGG